MLQKCWEVKKQREEFVFSKWFNINKYLAYKKINCTNVMELKILENMCLKISSKWENKINKVQFSIEVTGGQKCKSRKGIGER
jgi:hypothetical protein